MSTEDQQQRKQEKKAASPASQVQKKEQPSTYVVQDRQNEQELARLTIQYRLATTVMGGVLSEQPDPTAFDRVLDVACGTGGWLIEVAKTYPATLLIGVDISNRMIDYAREQAVAQHVADRVEFHVMDALLMLEFPASFFDLVNMRFGLGFMRTWDWPKLLSEFLRVARPGGVVRVTDSIVGSQNNSPALMELFAQLQYALYRAGHLFTPEPAGLLDHLEKLLVQHGCKQVQVKEGKDAYGVGKELKKLCCTVNYALNEITQLMQQHVALPLLFLASLWAKDDTGRCAMGVEFAGGIA